MITITKELHKQIKTDIENERNKAMASEINKYRDRAMQQ